jgi:hypothetical protein
VPSTQGEPQARAWARQRGESTIEPQRAGVWYEVARDSSHNYTTGLDGGLVSYWLLRVLDDSLR